MPPTTYRKKPVEIEAIRFDGSNADEITSWLDDNGGAGHKAFDDNGPHLLIYTLEGVMRASAGDFVCRGTEGEFYPCKEAAFHASHEQVTAAEPAAEATGDPAGEVQA